MVHTNIEANSTIIKQGEPANFFYVLLRGKRIILLYIPPLVLNSSVGHMDTYSTYTLFTFISGKVHALTDGDTTTNQILKPGAVLH
jgi:CRP-like cAMP-binding protein